MLHGASGVPEELVKVHQIKPMTNLPILVHFQFVLLDSTATVLRVNSETVSASANRAV